MRKLIDAVNIDAPSGDYPKGRVRNKNGAILGTEYREELLGDFCQFFQKLIIDAGITENDLPDNVTNGYQLFEALDLEIKKRSEPSATIVQTFNGTFNSGTNNITAEPYHRMIYVLIDGTSTYEVTATFGGFIVGWALGTNQIAFMLPANEAATVDHVAGTGTLVVRTQKIGV